MTRFTAATLAATALSFAFMAPAAEAGVCGSGTDATFMIGATNYTADECSVALGNDDATAIGGLFTGDAWSFLARDNVGGSDDSNTVFGVKWTLTATDITSPGTFTLTWEDVGGPSLPLTLDVVFAVKGGTSFAAYLFNNPAITFGTSPTSGNGTYSYTFTVGSGNIPELSHVSMYARNPRTEVPEPTTLALMGLGLAGLGFASRRRRKA